MKIPKQKTNIKDLNKKPQDTKKDDLGDFLKDLDKISNNAINDPSQYLGEDSDGFLASLTKGFNFDGNI